MPLTGLGLLWSKEHTALHSRYPDLNLKAGYDVNLPIVTVYWSSLVAQMVKNLPAMQETWAQTLGQEDALEKKNGYPLQYSCWRIPGTEEPSGLQSTGSQRVGHS